MSKRITKKYPSEFKESSVQLAVESGQSIGQIARDLGIPSTTLHTWIKQYSNPEKVQIYSKQHHFDEIRALKKRLALVSQERDLLKKAAAYFAKESR